MEKKLKEIKEIKKVSQSINMLRIHPNVIVQDDHSDKSMYWNIGLVDGNNFTGIGYNVEKNYFYHNTHSGNIMTPDKQIGSAWNHTSKDKPGPGGWYTFNEQYILDLISNMKLKVTKSIKHISEKRITSLNDSIGFLGNYTTPAKELNEEHTVVNMDGKVIENKTLLLRRLGELNIERERIMKQLLTK